MASTCSRDINGPLVPSAALSAGHGKITNASSTPRTRSSSSTATRCAESWMTSDASHRRSRPRLQFNQHDQTVGSR